jgi:CheY-like chemotaxis protein/DNA-binding XRE family transcriptional regulator
MIAGVDEKRTAINAPEKMSDADVKTNFATAVRSRRSQLGMTQEELAERADLHRTYISDIERAARNLSLESISKLARALEMSVAALFTRPETSNGHGVNGGINQLVEVLLVEDNPYDEEMTLHAFRAARFTNKVNVVRDGVEALDYLFRRGIYSTRDGEGRPHVILLDLNLPKISGIDVLRRIRADQKAREIPVVVLTVSQKERDMAECRSLGVEAYIPKPVDLQRLIQVTPLLQLDWALVQHRAAAP